VFTLTELFGNEPISHESKKQLVGHFGALVIGEERAKEEAAALATLDNPEHIFGPLVTDATDAQAPAPPPYAIVVRSFEDLERAVSEKPEARDALLMQEIARKPRPWKKSLLLFLELEKHRTGGPREIVLKKLDAALGPREAATE